MSVKLAIACLQLTVCHFSKNRLDVLQEGFLVLWDALANLVSATSRFTWLYKHTHLSVGQLDEGGKSIALIEGMGVDVAAVVVDHRELLEHLVKLALVLFKLFRAAVSTIQRLRFRTRTGQTVRRTSDRALA